VILCTSRSSDALSLKPYVLRLPSKSESLDARDSHCASNTRSVSQKQQLDPYRNLRIHRFSHIPSASPPSTMKSIYSLPSRRSRRQSSIPHYQTFPTPPPRSRGKQLSRSGSNEQDDEADAISSCSNHESPLPSGQLAILAVIALAEQTALNSISPYLPQMVAGFPGTDSSRIGLYVGAIGSAFASAQFTTGYFWGWLSDRIGRKPVILLGTLLTSLCFVAFGFCGKFWEAVVVQGLIGLVNGNQGVVSTCLGEITDRRNQSRAFVWLPVIYGIGAITGPAMGGLLVMEKNPWGKGKNPYPYLLPNMLAAAILMIDFVLTSIFLEESLDEARELPPLKERFNTLFAWMWQFISGATRPTYVRRRNFRRHRRGSMGSTGRRHGSMDSYTDAGDDSERESLLSLPEVFTQNTAALTSKAILNRNSLLLLGTYLVFQLSSIGFNTLYPIFAFAPPPIGRGISARSIGISLSAAGMATIFFQVFVFGKLKERVGNKATYGAGLGVFAVAMAAMPFVCYRDSAPLFGIGTGEVWMWIELGSILLLKTIASVGGLTSALLLITNSSPSPGALGALNGLAQTLSAAGRAIGPLISGGLFSAAANVMPKGELIPFGVFAGIAGVGFIASFWINGAKLESEEYQEEHPEEEEEDAEEDEEEDEENDQSEENV